MSETKEQVKPLAPEGHRLHILVDDDDQLPDAAAGDLAVPNNHHHSYCIKCCGCSTAVLLIMATIVLVLMFTVFRIKDPILKMNSVTLQGLDLLISNSNKTGLNNLTLETNLSIKNPNAASFRFGNTTTFVYYDGSVVGESSRVSLSGEARARRTVKLNVTVDLTAGRMMGSGRMKGDLDRGILAISSYTRISGKVKIGGVVKRHLVVRLNCTMNINVRSRGIQDTTCTSWSMHSF